MGCFDAADRANIKSCFCAEVVSLIYGIILAIITGVASLICICLLIGETKYYLDHKELDLPLDMLFVFGGYAIVGFLFSVLLVHSVLKKNAKPLLMYLVFGILSTLLFVIVTLAFTFFIPSCSIWLLVCLIYGLPLISVWMTYNRNKTLQKPTINYVTLNSSLNESLLPTGQQPSHYCPHA